MNIVSRRQILTVSVIAIAEGYVHNRSGAAFAQPVRQGASPKSVNSDLQNHILGTLGALNAKRRKGPLTAEDYRKAASVLRLQANHLKSTGYSDAFAQFATNLNPATIPLPQPGILPAGMLEEIRKYDPTAEEEDYAPTDWVTREQLTVRIKHACTKSLTDHHLYLAAAMSYVAEFAPRQVVKDSSYSSALSLSGSRTVGRNLRTALEYDDAASTSYQEASWSICNHLPANFCVDGPPDSSDLDGVNNILAAAGIACLVPGFAASGAGTVVCAFAAGFAAGLALANVLYKHCCLGQSWSQAAS